MGCELSHQIGLQLRQFLGQPSRNRLRSQLTRLPSLFQIAFEGGQRHAKQLHDLSSRAALVYRTHHSFPQIFRIRFHTSCSLSLLASRSFTYSITWLNSSASRCIRLLMFSLTRVSLIAASCFLAGTVSLTFQIMVALALSSHPPMPPFHLFQVL